MDAPVRALTVTALYLLPQEEAGAQMDLFHGAQDQKRERLEKLAGAMDAIRAKYGKGAIAPASCPRDPGRTSTPRRREGGMIERDRLTITQKII